MNGFSFAYIEPEVAIHFRDELRAARAAVLRDAEAFDEILFTVERLGMQITGKVLDLGRYQARILELVQRSTLAKASINCGLWNINVEELYELVRKGRNEAMHVGAYARHLAASAVELAIILEDALMSNARLVSEVMVKNPVQAYLWQPITLIRHTMLANSFSYLPVFVKGKADDACWHWVSDFSVASYLRAADANERRDRLAIPLSQALETDRIHLDIARTCRPDEQIDNALQKSQGKPILVTEAESNGAVGIVTPFDFL
jgi:hypothetical protein